MLASGPLYASGTFWAGVGVTVAVATLVSSIVLWRLGGPRRVLAYSLAFAEPMLTPSARGLHGGVLINGTPLTDPYAVILRLQNKSRRDIRSNDFDQDKPLHFDLGVKIVQHGSKSIADYVVSDTGVDFGPVLIIARRILLVSFVTDGAPHITCHSPLVNIAVRQQDNSQAPSSVPSMIMLWISGAMLAFGVFALTGTTRTSSNVALGIALIAASVAGGVLMFLMHLSDDRSAIRRRKRRRR